MNRTCTLIRLARSTDWPGYFGSPRLADAVSAASGWHLAARYTIDLALQILDGLDAKSITRFSDEMSNSPADVRLDKASLRHEAAIKRRQQQWLKPNKLR